MNTRKVLKFSLLSTPNHLSIPHRINIKRKKRKKIYKRAGAGNKKFTFPKLAPVTKIVFFYYFIYIKTSFYPTLHDHKKKEKRKKYYTKVRHI